MSKAQPSSEGELAAVRRQPADPRRNPSYPAREHLHEKPHWLGVLQKAQARVADFERRLGVTTNDPQRPKFERLFAQMLGSIDQITDAVNRLPAETGDLYEEDKHRVEEAIAALERIAQRW